MWAAGRGPDPSFTAMVFETCDRVLGPELCRTKALQEDARNCNAGSAERQVKARFEATVVSSQFRK